MSDKADLVGAVRLPNTAFKQNANTEVTTDIVFLRKLAPGERPNGTPWMNIAEHRNADGQRFHINEYFVANPHMMLGHMRNGGSMYRNGEPTLQADGRDLGAALREVILQLPEGILCKADLTVQLRSSAMEQVLAPNHVKDGAFTIHEGAIAVRTGETLTPVSGLPEKLAERIRGLISVRDAVREALRTQLESDNEETALLARKYLNRVYDGFVSRYGPVSQRANWRAFADDPDMPLLLSLEDYSEETGQANKTAIFFQRTIQRARPVTFAETPQDALVLTLNETGRVDLDNMEKLLLRAREEFLPELKGLIYRNPQTEQWETEDQYLSGNVRSSQMRGLPQLPIRDTPRTSKH